MTTPATTPTATDRLKALRQKEAERIEKLENESEARELEALELAEKLSEGGKVRGQDFEVVATDFGVFGVAKPDARGWAQWEKAADEKPLNNDKVAGIIRHYILPDPQSQMRFHAIATDRPLVLGPVITAFAALQGGARLDSKKK